MCQIVANVLVCELQLWLNQLHPVLPIYWLPLFFVMNDIYILVADTFWNW